MSTSNLLDRNNVEDILALTPTQEGMLFHYIQQPESEMYFEQLSIRLTGDINISRLKEAWKFVVDSNEMLRTVFRWENVEKPVQIVLKNFEPDIREYDFSHVHSSKKEELLSDWREADRKERIDISSKPYRILLCRLDTNQLEMVISNHHILYDGWSTGLILKELFDAYDSLCEGTVLSHTLKSKFKEYIKWIQTLNKEKHAEFWKGYLDNVSAKTELPYDNGHSAHSGIKNHILSFPEELYIQINHFARKNELTLASILYCGWGILLQKYSGTTDAVFGTTVSGRAPEIKGIEEMVGLLINTIPLRVMGTDEQSLMEILRKVDSDLIERQEYQASSITDIKNYIRFDRKQNLFDSILVIENYPLDKSLNEEGRKLAIQSYDMFEMTNFALTVGITCTEEVSANFIYYGDLFSDETVKQMSNHYADTIKTIVTSPEICLGDIKIFNEEQEAVIKMRNAARKIQPVSEPETYEFREPENEIEMALSAIWKKVLGVDRIGTRDNFFDIGGTSILLIQVHAKIEKIYPGILTGADLFTYPTITKLAQYINRKINKGEQEINLKGVRLPEHYFVTAETGSDGGVLRFTFRDEIAKRIKDAAVSESTSVHTLLLSMFMYMFTELSESKNVTVQVPAGSGAAAMPLAINLDEISGFSMLFKTIENRLSIKEAVYDINEAVREMRKKEENTVIPFFCRTGEVAGNSGFNELYDIIFEMHHEENCVNFLCQYNYLRLRKETVKELIDGYCELVESLVAQYENL